MLKRVDAPLVFGAGPHTGKPVGPAGVPGGQASGGTTPARVEAEAEARSEARTEARNDGGEGTSSRGAVTGGGNAGTLGLLTIAVVMVLYVGESVFLPVFAAILLYFLFSPVVRFAEKWWIPRALSASGVLLFILAILGLSIYGLAGPAGSWMKKLPHAVEQMGTKLQALRKPMDQVTAAARQVEELSKPGAVPAHGSRGDATATATAGGAEGKDAKEDELKADGDAAATGADAQASGLNSAAAPGADGNAAQAHAQQTVRAAQQTLHDVNADARKKEDAAAEAAESDAHSNLWAGGGRGRDFGPAAAKPAAGNAAGNAQANNPANGSANGAGKSPESSAITLSQPSVIAPYLLSGTFGVIGFLGELFITLVTLFFLLSTGGTLLNRAVVLIPALRRNPDPGQVYQTAPQTDASAVLRESERQVGMYLRTTLMINTGLAVVISALFWAVGMPNPVLWGVMAGVLNFLPYVGPVIGVVIVFLAGLVTFDTFGQAVVAPLIYVGCAFLEGNLLTPWIMGMRLALSPLAIFLWMMFWGFMWGAAGAIIAVPLLVMVREFCNRIEGLNGVGRLIEP